MVCEPRNWAINGVTRVNSVDVPTLRKSPVVHALELAICVNMALPAGALAQAQPKQATPAPQAQASAYSDAQLRAFAAASTEIDPISRALPDASTEQRSAAAGQIRSILQRHNIDSATYNAIAAQAQTDAALAARINALRAPAPAQPSPTPQKQQ